MDTGLCSGRYDYRIIAFNRTGDSQPSNVVSIVVPEQLLTPTLFRIVRRGFYSITLGWEDVSDSETGFSLERSRSDSLHFIEIAVLTAYTTSFEDSLLDPGTQYYYRLRSYNQTDWSDYSEIISGITRIPLLGFDPASITANAGDRVTLALYLADPLSVFFGISLHIRFDDSVLKFIAFNAGDLFGPDLITFSEQLENTVYITLTLKQGIPQIRASGKMAALTFEALSSGSGELTIPPENVHFYDASGNEVDKSYLQIQNGRIIVQ
jgi:hypothetical protein